MSNLKEINVSLTHAAPPSPQAGARRAQTYYRIAFPGRRFAFPGRRFAFPGRRFAFPGDAAGHRTGSRPRQRGPPRPSRGIYWH